MVGVLCKCGEMLRMHTQVCPNCKSKVPGPHGATPSDVEQAEKARASSDETNAANQQQKGQKVHPGPHGAPPQESDEIVVPGPHGAAPSIIAR